MAGNSKAVPAGIAKLISQQADDSDPSGSARGSACDGQILLCYDLPRRVHRFQEPKFTKAPLPS